MPTLGDALRQGIDLLSKDEIPSPRLTAEVLLAHAVRKDRTWLYAHPEYTLSDLEWLHYGRYLHERLGGKPTQYITKVQEWYGRLFRVSPAVLIPRPETEHVIERALQLGGERILDIGTGSGAIAVTLALEMKAKVVATDLSIEAVRVARDNADAFRAEVEFVNCDLASAIAGEFDLVVSNPPYVPDDELPGLQREVRDFEPRVALDGGEEGLALYRRIIPEAGRLLRRGGHLLFEMGYRSEPGIRASLGPCWQEIESLHDLAGLPRVLSARYEP